MKNIRKVESELKCKATSELVTQVSGEMNNEDKPLEELLNETDDNEEVRDKFSEGGDEQ